MFVVTSIVARVLVHSRAFGSSPSVHYDVNSSLRLQGNHAQ